MILNLWRTILIIMSAIEIGLTLRLTLTRMKIERHFDNNERPYWVTPYWATVAWLLQTIFITIVIISRYKKELSWQTPYATVTFTIALMALIQTMKIRVKK